MSADWEKFEAHVAELLGLRRTTTSGSRWHDPGDAVTVDRDDPFPLLVECKQTAGVSSTLRLKMLRSWARTAAESGRRFVMAIRIQPPGQKAMDVVVLLKDDFVEILERAKKAQS